MANGWRTVAETWRWRHAWLWPLVLTPLLVVAFVMSRAPVYTGSITLQIDGQQSTPLLQDLSRPAARDVLMRALLRPEMLADTAQQAGQAVDTANLRLDVLNAHLVRLVYYAPTPTGLDNLMSVLAENFIYEVLAPERLRLDQQQAQIGRELRNVETLLLQDGGVSGTVAVDRQALRARAEILRRQYQDTMGELSTMNGAFDANGPRALMWPAEPPVVIRPVSWPVRLGGALLIGLGLGVVLAAAAAGARQRRRQGTILAGTVKETGEPLVGQLPNLGAVNVLPDTINNDGGWKASISTGTVMVDPVNFTEVIRLHRALLRGRRPLVLTSCTEGEGKTLLAALLGLRSQRLDKPTLLVDLNLKDAALTRMFGARPAEWHLKAPSRGRGGRAKAEVNGWVAAVKPLSPDGDGSLSLLPAPVDADTLAFLQHGPQVLAWLDELGQHFEHIIIDTSPLLAANRQNADPVTLAASSRAVLVAAGGVTPLVTVNHGLTLLRQQGVNLLGVVLNDRHNPDDRTLVLQMCRVIDHVLPGLGQWLRAKALKEMGV